MTSKLVYEINLSTQYLRETVQNSFIKMTLFGVSDFALSSFQNQWGNKKNNFSGLRCIHQRERTVVSCLVDRRSCFAWLSQCLWALYDLNSSLGVALCEYICHGSWPRPTSCLNGANHLLCLVAKSALGKLALMKMCPLKEMFVWP